MCPVYLLSLVPNVGVSQEFLRPGGEVELEREAEDFVHGSQEVQAALDLFFNLLVKQVQRTSVKFLSNSEICVLLLVMLHVSNCNRKEL